MTNWLDIVIPFSSPIITGLLNLGEKWFYKRRKKIKDEILWKNTTEQIEIYINESFKKQESNFLTAYNLSEIFKNAILDFEFDDQLKTRLLNLEIQEIFKNDSYKYVYNKLSALDLRTLEQIGKTIEKKFPGIYQSKRHFFVPTYALLDPTHIKYDDSKEEKSALGFKNKIYFNCFSFVGTNMDKQNLLNKYNECIDSIFNLANLGLINVDPYDNIIVPSIDIYEIRALYPFAIVLTNKGYKTFEMIKEK